MVFIVKQTTKQTTWLVLQSRLPTIIVQSVINDKIKDNMFSTKLTDNNERKAVDTGYKEESIHRAKNEKLRQSHVLGSGEFIALEKVMGMDFNVLIRKGRISWDFQEVRLQVTFYVRILFSEKNKNIVPDNSKQ